MKFIHKGKIIPNYVVRFEESDGKDKMLLVPVKDEWLNNRFFLQSCGNERDLGPAYPDHPEYKTPMQEFMEKTTMIQKTWLGKDGRWTSGRFTKEEFLDLVARAKANGHIPQYGKAKWLVGGGRAAKAAGKFFYANEDVTSRLYRERLQVNPDRLDAREKIARAPILLSSPLLLAEPPVIKFTDNKTYGVVYVSEAYAAKNGLHDGDKLWPVKGSVMVVHVNLMQGVDMLVSKDDSKFLDHTEDSGLLSNMMGMMPELTAMARSSLEKNRVPRLALDTMQWLYPEIGGLMDNDQHLHERLLIARSIVEGTASVEVVKSITEFTKKDGTKGYPTGVMLMEKGQPVEDWRVREALMKAAGTFTFKSLAPRINGAYGVCMPLRGVKTRRRLTFMPPWMLPCWVDTELTRNVVSCDTDWVVGFLGKDFDGDIAIVLFLEERMRQLGISEDIFPDWKKPEDQAWARKWMALPEKHKAKDPRDVYQVMVDGLQGYGLIGVATNMAMTVVDALRVQGVDRRTLMGTYLKMMSMEVQPFVDSIKYTPGGLWKPRFEDFTSKRGAFYPGLCRKYGASLEVTECLVPYFRAVRSMNFDALAALPVNAALKGSFYYHIASMFSGWQPVGEVNMQQVGFHVGQLDGYKLPEGSFINHLRGRSYAVHGNNMEARLAEILSKVNTPELQMAMAAVCWAKKDTALALELERRAGARCIDLYKTKVLIQAPEPKVEDATVVTEE